MSNVYSLVNDNVMFEQASQWIAKMDRALDDKEQLLFKLWLAEDLQHQKLIIEMASLWDKMDALEQLADLFPTNNKVEPKVANITKKVIALAASVVIVFFVGLLSRDKINVWLNNDQQFVRYETAVGESSTIILPDNSKVLLNTNSVLLVKYTDKYRLLKLQRGELMVQVAHNKKRPLSVIANHKVIQAVGTAFSVQVNAQKVELIVTDGRVLVGQLKPKQKINVESLDIPRNSLAVSKGEIASLGVSKNGHSDNKVMKIDPATISKNLSWRQGNIVFKGESLAKALKEVNRYTNVKFEIADEELKKIKIAGRFKTGDIKGLINALNHTFNIKTDRINKNLIVLRKQG